jgi:hypothetical protein
MPVDNQRGRGAAIAGFRAELFESRFKLSWLHQIESYQNLSEDQEP